MHKTLSIFALLLFGGVMAFGQVPASPKIHLEAQDSVVSDILSGRIVSIPVSQRRTTNFNPSTNISDSAMLFIFDSLRTDGRATIITVYETDVIDTVGLWQIGSGSNRAQWLNSQRVSYEDFAITYRDSTEQGVIIHTMLYQYPRTDSTYDGHDTIYLGIEGNTVGDKNFCALYYYPGTLNYNNQRQLESALAIRYGALLHGPYINSLSDTIWDPLGTDSLYGFGVCGIGRDDSLSLLQPKSIIRNGFLSIEAAGGIDNLTHIMMGHNGGEYNYGEDVVSIDTVQYAVVERQWKLRAHGNGATELIRFVAELPIPANAVRLMLTTGDNAEILTPAESDGIVFDSVAIVDGQDYYISLLIDPTAIPRKGKGSGCENGIEVIDNYEADFAVADFRFTVHPNPTTGGYTADISLIEEDVISIQVLDAAGRVVELYTSDEKLAQYKHTGVFDTDGVYYVTVSSNGWQKTIKIVVIR